MCGIAGYFRQDNHSEATADDKLLAKFLDGLTHRGPDGCGRWKQDSVGLVHTRLAIVDVECGAQPFVNELGQVLVANAEIYNHEQLKSTIMLQDSDREFQSQSDCEPILHLYRDYGLDFVEKLRGMYALAIYDPHAERLVLVRDPFGIKPLYYAETSSGFFFASEIRPLLHAGDDIEMSEELDERSRNALLELQFTLGERTIYRHVRRVLPGDILVVENGRVVSRRLHRDNLCSVSVRRELSEEQALAELDNLLKESVQLHLKSDRPVGLFLSGGIDSAAILTVANQDYNYPLDTFTIGFASTTVHDERVQAKAFASCGPGKHHEIYCDENNFWTSLPLAVAACDDPVADYAVVAMYQLAEAAKSRVKVILSGEGGDELFAGYDYYKNCVFNGPAPQPASPLTAQRHERVLTTLSKSGVIGNAYKRQGFCEQLQLGSWDRKWRIALDESEALYESSCETPLQVAQLTDLNHWLCNDLLTKLDRCLMQHGIEGRTPFLDQRVAEFALHLPDSFKVREGTGKWLLREWLKRRNPAWQISSRKLGLSVPIAYWIEQKSTEIGHLVARQQGVRELPLHVDLVEYFSNATTAADRHAQWILLYYAIWHEIHVNKTRPSDVLQFLAS